jgi:hypothetical protein
MVYLMEEIKNERNERLPISFIKANNILQFIENTQKFLSAHWVKGSKRAFFEKASKFIIDLFTRTFFFFTLLKLFKVAFSSKYLWSNYVNHWFILYYLVILQSIIINLIIEDTIFTGAINFNSFLYIILISSYVA